MTGSASRSATGLLRHTSSGRVRLQENSTDRTWMIGGLDHVQLAMPRGGEERARAYFGGLLGLVEVEKPAALAGRGGVWFGLPDGRQLHLGVEEAFRPSAKAHPAFG